jgi:hypothetical protein
MDLYAFTDTMSSPSPIAIPSPFLVAKSRPKEWKQQQTESSIFTNHNKLKTRAALGRAEKNTSSMRQTRDTSHIQFPTAGIVLHKPHRTTSQMACDRLS